MPVTTPAGSFNGGCGCGCGGAVCRAEASSVGGAGDAPRASVPAPTGRALARARREALARDGKNGIQRVSQAARLVATLPQADWKAVLDKGATGRQLAMQRRLVQSLSGRVATAATPSSRPSGRIRPRPAASLSTSGVEESRTLQGQRVTGLNLSRSPRVTGDEHGACRLVTGDEYLGADHYEAACEQIPVPEAAKVVSSQTLGGNSVTGPAMRAGSRITGNETGLCRGITGTQYLSGEDIALCMTERPRQPQKVSVMSSRGGQAVTGTAVATPVPEVTGAEAGRERTITGTQYARFLQTNVISGHSGRQPATWRPQSATGDTPGVGGGDITGDERGACEPVTGTPYIGPDNLHASCTVSSRWLTRFPQANSAPAVEPPSDFSVRSPARLARERREAVVTGIPSQADDRITGPGNKAGGLVTGTPEFRHRKGGAPEWNAQKSSAYRLTGEGSQSGVRITGDAWGSTGRVTGTEGPSAAARNPSLRGQPRSVGTHARAHRDLPRADVPASPVTGSSGTTERGAVVTVSGGARG
ncbi:CsoS2 family carboxysome shell protein [Tepidimonas charontis]